MSGKKRLVSGRRRHQGAAAITPVCGNKSRKRKFALVSGPHSFNTSDTTEVICSSILQQQHRARAAR